MAKNNNSMSQDELRELSDACASIALADAQLGHVLDLLLAQLARLNNLEYPIPLEPASEEVAPASQEQGV